MSARQHRPSASKADGPRSIWMRTKAWSNRLKANRPTADAEADAEGRQDDAHGHREHLDLGWALKISNLRNTLIANRSMAAGQRTHGDRGGDPD